MQFDPKSFILDDEPWDFQIVSGSAFANTRPASVGDIQIIQSISVSGGDKSMLDYIAGLGVTETDRSIIAAMPIELQSIALVGYMAYTQARLQKKSQRAASWVNAQLALTKSTSRS
jgi:hypothetical protein